MDTETVRLIFKLKSILFKLLIIRSIVCMPAFLPTSSKVGKPACFTIVRQAGGSDNFNYF